MQQATTQLLYQLPIMHHYSFAFLFMALPLGS